MASFDKIQTDHPDINRLQQNIAAALASLSAPSQFSASSVTADYRATGMEGVIHVDASRGPVRITLPVPSKLMPPLTIKQVNTAGTFGAVTVVASAGKKTIAGANVFSLDDSGTGSVTFTSDGQQHWPSAGSGGNPPASPAASTVIRYVGKDPIQVVGNVISIKPQPTPPSVTPWVAPLVMPGLFQNKTGAETWLDEALIDFSAAPSAITLYWWFQALTSAGNGVFSIRIGGSAYKALDGAVAATWTETSTTLAARSVPSVGMSAPVGVQRVTLTGKSSSGTAVAQIQGVNLQFK